MDDFVEVDAFSWLESEDAAATLRRDQTWSVTCGSVVAVGDNFLETVKLCKARVDRKREGERIAQENFRRGLR